MKKIFQNKITALTIVVLVILNIVCLTFIFDKKESCENRRNKKHLYFKEKLGLTIEQSIRFDSLKTIHYQKVHKELDEIHKKRDEVMSCFLEGDTVGGHVDSLFEMIAEHKANLERYTYRYYSTLKQECTEEQKLEFDSIMFKMLNFKR